MYSKLADILMRSIVSHLKSGLRTSLYISSGLLVVACGGDDAGSSNGRDRGGFGMRGGGSGQGAAIPVQVAAVRRGDISKFLLQTTTIEAEKQVEVISKVSGLVVKLPAEEGDRVTKGDLLAQLDEDELKIEHIQAKIGLETDRSLFERSKNMLDKQLISDETFETARLKYESSKATFESADLKLRHTWIRSPIDGIVTIRSIELGQRINANQVLFQVADFEPLRARIYVPEKDMAQIFEKQQAKITVESDATLDFTGVVKMISPVVDPTSGTAKVTLDIADHRGKLKPGMFATVYITTQKHTNTLLIPKKALILESEIDQVYTFDDGIARKANLKLGFASGEDVEVLSGLNEGTLVITVGQEGLSEGLPVKLPGVEGTLTQAPDKATTDGGHLASRRADGGEHPSGDSDRDDAHFQRGGADGESQPRNWQGGGGAVDPERLKRMMDRVLANPDARAAYDKRVKEDPDFENNDEARMAFVREMFQQMGGRGERRPRRN